MSDSTMIDLTTNPATDEVARLTEENERLRLLLRPALLAAMREYSELYWSSGWYSGVEFILWPLVASVPPGHWENEPLLQQIRELRIEARGWWTWPHSEDQEVFVSLEAFEEILRLKEECKTYTVHQCIDLDAALKFWTDEQMTGLFIHKDGQPYSPESAREKFRELTNQGAKLIPICSVEECPDFDYQGGGCPGHPPIKEVEA